MPPEIRWMTPRDVPDVADVEAVSFADPWSNADFDRFALLRNAMVLVAIDRTRVVGYAAFELRPDRLEVRRLAVAPDRRREGIGRLLMARVFAKLRVDRRRTLTVVVRERNVAGCLFLRKLGLGWTETLRGHYRETGEDAYVMLRGLAVRNNGDGSISIGPTQRDGGKGGAK